MEPAAPCQSPHQRRKRGKPHSHAAKEMNKAPGPGQVIVHDAAAFDESEDHARSQDGQNLDHSRDDRPEGRITVCTGMVMISEDKRGRQPQHSQKEKGQNDEEHHRPSGAQALAADEDPAQAAILWGFGRESCLGGRRFQLWGLIHWLHGASFKETKITFVLNSTDGKILYKMTVLGVP